MCGIAGIVTNYQTTPDPDTLKRMVDILVPRGPDGRGDFIQPGVALGHTRLKIIDLTDAGAQPMTDPSGRYTIVYNGEVYNYRELRGKIHPGYRFKSKTDTEVVLASYIHWGNKCLENFNGMFSFAIWDNEKRELFLARDRLGIKPLFYALVNSNLAFASEQKAIVVSGLVKREINPESIYHFLSFYHFPEPQTVYKNISSLPAGSYAIFKDGQLNTYKWWSPDFQKHLVTSDAKASDNLRVLLEDSTRLRQVADVPVGCFLSGGVDSTAVSAMMRNEVGAGFRTYTISFDDDPLNAEDVRYAQIASDRIGTQHEYRNILMDEIDNNLSSILWRLEEPAWSSLESWFVSKLARKGITVALAGVGGDELFAGYFPYSHVYRAKSFKKFLGPFATPSGQLFRTIDKLLPQTWKTNPPFSSLHRYASIDGLDYASAYFFLRSTFSEDEKHWLLTPEFLNDVQGISSLQYVKDLMKKVPEGSYFDKFALFDITNYLSADLLRHMDSMSMSHSLEVRVPLLDHRFAEYAFGLPDDMKIRDGRSKFIFQQSISSLLPDEIKRRSKVGFFFPMQRWLRTHYANELQRVLKSDAFRHRGIFNPGCVENLLQKYLTGDSSQWLRLWSILSIELWARMYIDSAGSEPKGVSFRDLAV